jgi:hypothetical protein
MQHAALAYALRQRQHAFGQVPDEMIEALSDDAIIDSYITCSCCGRKQVTPQQLSLAIALATDTESFFTFCDQLSGHHA